jgi:hypothetical protein
VIWSKLIESSRRSAATTWLVGPLLGLAALLFSLATFELSNDHFGRISPARQIARAGELPFRDFFDPGYFLTELSSAAFQRLLGDSLIGEALLTSGFIAAGTVLVWLLARHISGSSLTGVIAAVLALMFFPREYDYDKVLFYPMGVLLAWRYVERPTVARVWALAAGLVVAGLYRYDTGVFIAAAAAVSMAVVHAREWGTLSRRLGLLAGTSLCISMPALVFVQFNGGLVNAADQMVTYGRRETARTQLHNPPKLSIERLAIVEEKPPRVVLVRWAQSVDGAARAAAEARHGLAGGRLQDSPEERTWEYRLADESSTTLRALLTDPEVEDTAGIDRLNVDLARETIGARMLRAIPLLRVRLLPGAWHVDNANAFLYQLFRLLPLVALVVLVFDARVPGRSSLQQTARLTGIATLCFALNVFIMRDPVYARIGGMAGPAAILAAWVVRRVGGLQRAALRWAARIIAALVLMVTVWSISVSANWHMRIRADIARPSHLAQAIKVLAASPPSLELLPNSELFHLVRYLRECTSPRERVFLTWFAPEVYFFAQRGFAGGIAVLFGEHWSEPRFMNKAVQILEAQSPPIVVSRYGDDSIRKTYPALARYLDEHYEQTGEAAASAANSAARYVVYGRRDRRAFHAYGESNLPCYR